MVDLPNGLGGAQSLINNALDALGLLSSDGASMVGKTMSIVELDGKKRAITLTGRSMPYSAVDWAVEQRVKTTWYPGNPVASQQVLGGQEQPTVMKGTWKDRFITNSFQIIGIDIGTAENAVLLFHEICRSGVPLRVQWLSEVRKGILTRFTPTWLRATDCEWEMEFTWGSRNDEVAPRGATLAEDSPFDLLNKIENILADGALALDIARGFTALIVSSINNIRDGVSQVFDILRLADTLLELPGAVLGALQAAVGSLSRELNELIQNLGSRSNVVAGNDVSLPVVSPTAQSLSATGGAPPSSAATQTLQFENWRKNMIRGAAKLRASVQRSLIRQSARAQPNTARRIVVRGGDSLYRLSQEIYGSPDFANFLAQVNGLTTASVPAGFSLRVPPRPFSASVLPEVTGGLPSGANNGRCC
jgi:hypothetical protein